MRVGEYKGPLGVLAAGVIGVSLLCSVSAMAMSDLENQVLVTNAPLNIIDFAISNLSTAAGLTQQSVTQFVPTSTLVPTVTASLTPLPSNTPRRIVTITPTLPRKTRQPADVLPAPTRRIQTSVPPTDVPPTSAPPTIEPPTIEPPTATDPPVTEPPATEPPATQPPATEPPVATQQPVQDPVSTDAPLVP